MVTPLQEISPINTDYLCLNCRGVTDKSNVFSDTITALIDEEDDLNAEIVKMRVLCEDLNAKYKEIVGVREKSLNDALESIKIVRQACHGNVMVGNHCVIALKSYLVLTSVISDKKESFGIFNEIINIFDKMMSLVMARKFLNNEEIERLGGLCNDFGKKFPIYFPTRKTTRKIHELIFNVPRFVTKYRTIGMLSEQEGESKHASVNAELRSIANVRSHAERIHLVLQREELRSISDKSLLKPCKPRLM